MATRKPLKVHNPDTLLHNAVRDNDPKALALALAARPNVDKKLADDSCHIHYLATKGYAQCLGLLIAAGADLNARDSELATATILATRHDRNDCLELLIKAGAELDAYDEDGCTAVGLATDSESSVCLQLLIDAGVFLGAPQPNSNPSATKVPVWSPAHFAASNNNPDAIRLLAKAGAPLGLTDADGLTPAMVSATYRCEHALLAMIESGSDLAIFSKDFQGTTARGWALRRGHESTAAIILAYEESIMIASEGKANAGNAFKAGIHTTNTIYGYS